MIETTETEQEQKGLIKARHNRVLELYIWVFVAVLMVFPALYSLIREGIYVNYILNFYNQFILGFLVFLMPTLFKLIFGKLPFEYLRSKKVEAQGIKIQGRSDINVVVNSLTTKELNENYKVQCINESKTISEKIFSRSGVYLLVGCLIAFIGVAIFYSPLFHKTTSPEISQRLLDYLPRFGALFFIEFIAFFFLKQYRIMLEEYRYYEAIKRKRQDNLNLIELIEKHKDNSVLLKIISESISQTVITKLANGETTEILETQKIVNQDLDILSKFTDLLKEIKSK